MAQTAATPEIATPATPAIPIRDLGPWAVFFGLFAAIVVFFVSANQGGVSVPSGTAIHEWVHDARHLLGYPCH